MVEHHLVMVASAVEVVAVEHYLLVAAVAVVEVVAVEFVVSTAAAAALVADLVAEVEDAWAVVKIPDLWMKAFFGCCYYDEEGEHWRWSL